MAEKTFWTAFVKAQSEFEYISKDKSADAGKFKYEYASLPTVLEAILPALNSNGISLWQCFRDGSLVTNLTHTSGEGVESSFACSDSGLTPQDFGKKISYYRRYSILAMLGLAPDDDNDAQGVPAAPVARAKPKAEKVTPKPVEAEANDSEEHSEFRDAIHNLFDVGVGGLTGKTEDPKAEMSKRLTNILSHHGFKKVSEIIDRKAQTDVYHAFRDTVDAIETVNKQ